VDRTALQGLGNRLFASLAVEATSSILLELWRPAHRPPFGAEETDALEHLLPGLEIAVRWLLRSASAELQVRAFNRLPIALAHIGAERELLFHNAALRRLLAEGDGLRLVSGRVRAGSAQDERELAHRVRSAVAGSCPRSFLHVERPSGRPAYLLRVEPFVRRGHPVREDAPTAMLTVLDPVRCDRDAIVRTGVGYGLTRAEIRIAQLLLEGQGVGDIARRLDVTVHAVRWHLKRMFGKTHATGQADLLRLLVHAMYLSTL
jgi:DNA-binding CsgD family transcriptional regulator